MRNRFDYYGFGLGLLLMALPAIRLFTTNWTPGLGQLLIIELIAFGLGFLTGMSRFGFVAKGLLALVYGGFWVIWITGLVQTESAVWLSRLYEMGNRIRRIIEQLTLAEEVADPILFYLLAATLLWFLCFVAGGAMGSRKLPWITVVLSAAALLVIDLYHPGYNARGTYLFLFAVLSLASIAWSSTLRHHDEWSGTWLVNGRDNAFDLSRITWITLLLIVLFSWFVPPLLDPSPAGVRFRSQISDALSPAQEWWKNFTSPLADTVPTNAGIYGESLNLGRETLSGDIVLYEVTPVSDIPRSRIYWRVRHYDTYENGLWSTASADRISLNAEESLPLPGWIPEDLIALQIMVRQSALSSLVVVQNTSRISIPTQIQGVEYEDGSWDANTISPTRGLTEDDEYSISFHQNNPPALDLAEAAGNVPASISTRYLQLPGEFSDEMRSIARVAAGGAGSQYEQVVAVTQFLRQRITYKENVPAPPNGRDPIEWFLLEHKAGYCNYSASADVLLLRSLNIPARLVVGFAQSPLDADSGSYLIREQDAHAWVEVFFPEIGWVAFEPTVTQPITYDLLMLEEDIIRREEESQRTRAPTSQPPRSMTPSPSSTSSARDVSGTADSPFLWVILLLSLIGILTIFLIVCRRPNGARMGVFTLIRTVLQKNKVVVPAFLDRLEWYSRLSPIQRLFFWTEQSFLLLRLRPMSTLTPRERVHRWMPYLPGNQSALEMLLAEYERDVYTQIGGNSQRAFQAFRKIISGIMSQLVGIPHKKSEKDRE